MKAAFYAPMKSPDHQTPSGDRRVARLFMAALEKAGIEVELASSFRSFDKSGDEARQKEIQKEALLEADQLIEKYQARPEGERPTFWFTYHLYHKAPDWIGPKVAKTLDIPYLVAEASHAPKQSGGPWDMGYKGAAAAIAQADRVFHMTTLDGACLRQLVSERQKLVHIPPFIETDIPKGDPSIGRELIGRCGGDPDKHWLLSVGMMRSGDKFNSFEQLSHAVQMLDGDDWQLILVGDGPRRDDVQALFTGLGSKVVYTGQQEPQDLAHIYAAVDLYVWPASGEAFGMAFLEAARAGLPSVACRVRGVPDVIEDGQTGKLVPEGDMQALAQTIRSLLDSEGERKVMTKAAMAFVHEERNLEKASVFLKSHIKEVCP